MAIGYDAVSSVTDVAASSKTLSHIIGASANYLVVWVCLYRADQTTMLGVTFNGVAMHHLFVKGSPTAVFGVHCYTLESPAVGVHDIIVSFSNTCDTFTIIGTSYSGVDITVAWADFDNTSATAASGSPATVTLTTTKDNEWVLACAYAGGGAVNPNETQRAQLADQYSYGICAFDTNASVTPAGDQIMSATKGVGMWIIGVVALPPVVVSTTPTKVVTNLRHLSRPGSYRLEATFGGIDAGIEVVGYSKAKPPPEYIEVPPTDPIKYISGEFVPVTPTAPRSFWEELFRTIMFPNLGLRDTDEGSQQ